MASASLETTTSATLTIGGVSGTFSVTTAGIDTTPDAFSFAAATGVDASTLLVSVTVTSSPATITGINSPTTISVSGDLSSSYRVSSGAWTSLPGTVNNNETVQVRHTSAMTPSTAVSTTLTVGGVGATFTSTTKP